MFRDQSVQIGRWQLHDDARITSGDESHSLTPKAFDLLTFLVERPNQLVSNNDIVGALWSHEYVADASVYNLVSELRRALGDNSRAPAYIKTVARRGYMLVAEVTMEEPAAAIDHDLSTAPGQPRIAVLPFANLSNDPDQEYFSEGISEDILDALARNPDLTVRARQSSFFFKAGVSDIGEIAERLDVSHLVSGSVRTDGNRIRVTARLTDVAANADVWSARYDRELTDIFAVQDEITQAIVGALGLHFSAPESARRAVDLAAYDAYLAGRAHQNRLEMEEAVVCYTKATELDPGYADAYARLAQIYMTRVFLSWPGLDELLARGKELIARTLAIDPHQHLALGLNVTNLASQEAIDRLHALLRGHPNDSDLLMFYSFVLRRIGRFDLVAQIVDRMVELDPFSAETVNYRAWNHVSTGRLEQARADADRCEQLGLPQALNFAAIALLERDVAAAKVQCERPESDWRALPGWRELYAAFTAYLEGDREQVGSILASLENRNEELPGFNRFIIALLQDEIVVAADYLEAAIERGEVFALYNIQGDAVLRSLFPDFFASARYRALLKNLELDHESVARLTIPPLPFESPS